MVFTKTKRAGLGPAKKVNDLDFLRQKGIGVDKAIESLRPMQQEAINWALSSNKPYLFVNAPTGSGKTLMLGIIGTRLAPTWTYGVHTIMLQEQVARTFPGLPVMTGRSHHACEIGQETHKMDIMANEAICAVGEYCPFMGRPPREDAGEDAHELWEQHAPAGMCSYYAMRMRALTSPYRTANYAFLLADHRSLVEKTAVLLADEAHRIEDAVCNHGEVYLSAWTYQRFGLHLPNVSGPRVLGLRAWAEWAQKSLSTLPSRKGGRVKPDFGLVTAREQLRFLAALQPSDVGQWLVLPEAKGVRFQPIWGAPLVMKQLFGHAEVPNLLDNTQGGIRRVVFTSATLMGAEYIAEMLGLPQGSWDYLDLPSTFPVEHRPINYMPVMKMNAAVVKDPVGRTKMQDSIDNIIEWYVLHGARGGLIHAVSNFYRDSILTESRWREIMTSSLVEHEQHIRDGGSSVLVAANAAEGWDGRDDLCRFIIMPKIPYPNLGDKRTSVRKDEDSRTFDHAALVAVVQGAGRGVRHTEDYADTWILDKAWDFLAKKTEKWWPVSFKDAYHHGVQLPK